MPALDINIILALLSVLEQSTNAIFCNYLPNSIYPH